MSSPSRAADNPDPSYVHELVRRATEARLADQRYWRLLVHYRENLLTGYTSEADGKEFFLAPKGKTDPQAELASTLTMLFSEEPVGLTRQPAQCAFPARYHWLKSQLSFDPARLPPRRCERFEAWLKAIDAQSVTLIFPSAYMNNPSSMFGHILLRMDQRGQTEQTRILAYTINFAADAFNDNAIVYAALGLTGGFKGYFSTLPYYLKVREYRDTESRDIWEYRLSFTEPQVEQLLRHAWELGNTYFDYFYFKENCAYQILSLLEIADPALHLTDQFTVWTIPADTIRLIARQPGLISNIVFRPSLSTEIGSRHAALSETERGWVLRITENASLASSPAFQQLPADRQAFILQVVSHYLRYLSMAHEGKAAAYKARNAQVLSARSLLKVQAEDPPITSRTASPDQGHQTRRVGAGIGWRNDEFFEELNFRPAYHDLLDSGVGYSGEAQIEFMAISLRHYDKRDRFRVERVNVLDIISLSPMDALFQKPSWKLSTGFDTIRHNDCRYCGNANLNVGPGVSAESQWLRRELYFAFAEFDANYSNAYEENHRIGGGGTIGMLVDLTERWKALVSASYLRYPLGEKSDDVRVSFQQRYTLSKDFAIRLEFNHRDHDDQTLLTLQGYF